MNESFELPVIYGGRTLSFPAQLLQLGYTHKFQVEVYEQEVLFEPDEKGYYRAIIDLEKLNQQLDAGLLKAIAQVIESIVK